MDDLDTWIQETGTRIGQPTVKAWFEQHPDVRERLKAARERGLSWDSALKYLRDRHNYPFTSTDGLKEAASD